MLVINRPLSSRNTASFRFVAAPNAFARALLFLLFLPVLPFSLIASWRARRRLRSYGPAAVLALHDLPRFRTR